MRTARQVLHELRSWARHLDGTPDQKQAAAFQRGADELQIALDRIATLDDQLKDIDK
ncbi:hypothetical protein [Loktanella sp. 3ANDIMAR09]|uniref:hypothetical protein n=1 Tax=Loktanella sp. 3ANDIMAR09 TaxID=1225657 RepID=UPI000A75E8AD|nr:hypothetical protein [Loktanella sp. 3ANDIMAR09]